MGNHDQEGYREHTRGWSLNDVTLYRVSAAAWREWRGLRLQALRQAPDAFGATYSDWQGANDTEERWRRRLVDVPFNVMAHLHRTPVGQVSATAPDESRTVEMMSMWVAPVARGRGVGDALVHAVAAWTAEQRARRLIARVRDDNLYAIRLYLRTGFVDAGEAFATPDGHVERQMTLQMMEA